MSRSLTTGSLKSENPQDIEYYDYMKSYSPYDNVKAPGLSHLRTSDVTGLHDSECNTGEPAKWVANYAS